MRDLTREEHLAIRQLRRLAARWPNTLGLQAGTGGLNVIALDGPDRWPEGKAAWRDAYMDHVDVPAEGGDPW